MTGAEARAQIAQAIESVALPPWTTYPAPPETMSLPAVVVQTTSTRPGTFCAEVLTMTVTVLEARSAGVTGYDSVEAMAATIVPVLTAGEGIAYASTDQGPMIAPGGVEAYGATINLEMYLNQGEAMASTIVRKSILHFNFTGPVVVDLSCYATAVEIAVDTEVLDIGTFCNASASELGRTTYSATVSFLWEPALYTALQSKIGLAMVFAYAPDFNTNTEYLSFSSKFAAQPWGRFEIGQRVEVELPIAVLSTPIWNTGTQIP